MSKRALTLTACIAESTKSGGKKSYKGALRDKRPPVNPNSGWTGGLPAYSIELLFDVPVRDSFGTPVS